MKPEDVGFGQLMLGALLPVIGIFVVVGIAKVVQNLRNRR